MKKKKKQTISKIAKNVIMFLSFKSLFKQKKTSILLKQYIKINCYVKYGLKKDTPSFRSLYIINMHVISVGEGH